MFKVKYSDRVQLIIKEFIRSYKDSFLDRFTNTWMIWEDVIRESYILKSMAFYESIINNTDTLLSPENIFWNTFNSNDTKQIYININTFRIKVFYRC